MSRTPLPKYVQIEPVGQCNLRCQMCVIPFRDDGPPNGPPAFMNFELFTRLVDGFKGMETLHLQGLGEPMMHPRYFEMVAYAKGKGLRVTTNTNLTLLNPRRAEQCVTCGLDDLFVSIDGATAETYERIRLRGRFERVLRNLDLLLEARRRLGVEHPSLTMVVVVMRQNLEELPALVELAHRFTIPEVFVQHLAHAFTEESLPDQYRPMRAFVQEQTLLEEDPERVERCFEAAREVAERLRVRLRLPRTSVKVHPPGTPGPQRCSWPWSGAYIAYDGSAMPCCMVSTPDRANFGSMAALGVEQVWNGPEYEQFRLELSSDDPPEICAACSIYHGTF